MVEKCVHTDSRILHLAIAILRRESSKPNGFWLGVICRVLADQAQRLRDAGR